MKVRLDKGKAQFYKKLNVSPKIKSLIRLYNILKKEVK